MRRYLLRTVAAAAAFCLAPHAWSLDLAEAYRLAQQRDATIRQSRALAEAGRERLPQARSQLLPSISISSSRGKNQLESTSSLFGQTQTDFQRYNNSNDTLVLRQPIWRPQLTAQYAEAKAQVAGSNAQLERDEQNLVIRVTEAYFNVLFADEQLRLILVQKNAYEAQADAARKAFKAGTGTRTDIDEAQSRLDLTIAQELEARQNAEFMRRKLQVLVDQPVSDVAAIDVQKMALTPLLPANLDQWTQLADSSSPEVDAARAQVLAARAEVDKARAGHSPTLDAYAQLAHTQSDTVTSVNSKYYQKSIGVQLSIPIFSGGLVNSQVREALARLEAAQDQLEGLRRDLAVRVHQEYRGVTEGLAKVKALEQAVKSAEQLVVSSRRSFEAGVRTRLDILNAEQQAGTTRRDLAQARFDYLASRVRLRALAGSLRAENIDEINGWLQH